MTTVGIERKLRGQACSQGCSLEVWSLEFSFEVSRPSQLQGNEVATGPIHTTPQEFQNITITGKSYEYRDAIEFSFEVSRPSQLQGNEVATGPIHTTPEEFQNITITWKSYEYCDAIVFVDDRPNRRTKATFSNFSEWTLP